MLRLGRNEEAIADWQRGLKASGGTHTGLQRLLELARDGKAVLRQSAPFGPIYIRQRSEEAP